MIKITVPHTPGEYLQGIRANLDQFLFQLFQVFLVGMTIGLQRNVVPALAQQEFGLQSDSFTVLMSIVIAFGFVKGALNFIAGRLSETVGRRRILIWGWLVGIPIPFIILYAPAWHWIVAANILLGVNQGLAWSMTVTSKADITPAVQRGLATGFNEFAGYSGVAVAGIITGYLAADWDPRWALFVVGLTVIIGGLVTALLFAAETLHWARAEASRHAAGNHGGPLPRYPTGVSDKPSSWEMFCLVSFRHRTFAMLSQAGLVEKFVDALVWAFYPAWLYRQGLGVIEIGWVVGVFGLTWGASQLWTGPLSDRIGRKGPIVAGMWLCAAGVAATVSVSGMEAWLAAGAVTGVGMALLYPTLIASIADISRPDWRGSSLGTYRFWRDTGYGIGALMIGISSDITGQMETGFWLTAVAMGLSGLLVLVFAEETHPRINGANR